MAERQTQIPGGPFYVDTSELALYQRQVPGGPFVNEWSMHLPYPTLGRWEHHADFEFKTS
jgi:hypothetical protein